MALEYFKDEKGCSSLFTPRSKAKDVYPYRYTVQKKTPDRGWVASLRTNDGAEAVLQAEIISVDGGTARILDNMA